MFGGIFDTDMGTTPAASACHLSSANSPMPRTHTADGHDTGNFPPPASTDEDVAAGAYDSEEEGEEFDEEIDEEAEEEVDEESDYDSDEAADDEFDDYWDRCRDVPGFDVDSEERAWLDAVASGDSGARCRETVWALSHLQDGGVDGSEQKENEKVGDAATR
jgi:hypothetical protein